MSWMERYTGIPTAHASAAAPVQPAAHAHEYITNHVVHEFYKENKNIDPDALHEHIMTNYPSEIATIAAHNNHQRKPPTGIAGSLLSRLVLVLHLHLGLELSHRTAAKHEGRAILSSTCKPGVYGSNCPKDFSTEYY